ncbi:MAG: hypothetical protein ACKVJ0_02625 [Nitrosopumilus sp.]
MQKTGLFIVIFGILIAAGLGISVIENQITLEGIAQGNGKVNVEQVITISVNLDKDKTPVGIFAVQIMDFKENTFSAKIIDPSDIEIISNKILNSGDYELIIQSSDYKESYVAGAIGPLPDADKKLIITSSSTLCTIIGMGGLVIVAIYEIRNKRKSV